MAGRNRNNDMYQRPEAIDPGFVDVEPLKLFNPGVAGMDAQNLGQSQQRYDQSQTAIAKYIEDIGATSMREVDRENIYNKLQSDLDNIHKQVGKGGGDYGDYLPEIVKSLSKARGTLHLASQDYEKESALRKQYDAQVVSGQHPQKFIEDVDGKPVAVNMTFEEFAGGKAFDNEGQYQGYTPTSIRGRGDHAKWTMENISNPIMKGIIQGDLGGAGYGYLESIMKGGMSDDEVEELFKSEHGKDYVNSFLTNSTFASEEFKNADGSINVPLAKEYLKDLVKVQTSEILKKQYMQNPFAKNPNEGDKTPDGLNLPISKWGDSGNLTNTIPVETLRKDPKYAGQVKKAEEQVRKLPEYTKTEEEVISEFNTAIGKNLPKDEISILKSIFGINSDISNIPEDVLKKYAYLTSGQNKEESFKTFKSDLEKGGVNAMMGDIIFDKMIENHSIPTTKDNLRHNFIELVVKYTRNFNEAVDGVLKGYESNSQIVSPTIGSGFADVVSEWVNTNIVDELFINPKSTDDKLPTDFSKPDNIKNVLVTKGNLEFPTRLTLITKDNKKSNPLQMNKDKSDAKAQIRDLSFKGNDVEIYKSHMTHEYLSGLFNSDEVDLGNYKVTKIKKSDLPEGLQGAIIGEGDTYYYINDGEKALSPLYANPGDAMEAGLFLNGTQTPTDEFLKYLSDNNASKGDYQKTAEYLKNFKESITRVNNSK